MPHESFHVSPKFSSKAKQASSGRIMEGTVESIKVSIVDDSKDTAEPLALVEVIDSKPTTKSREMSGAKEKDTLFGMNRERSRPPNVKLPKNSLDPRKR